MTNLLVTYFCLACPDYGTFISFLFSFPFTVIDNRSVRVTFINTMETDTEVISIAAALKELHAYAKLLYLRDGRQFKDKTLYEEAEDEVSSNDSGNDDSSSKNVPLGSLDTGHLRRRFLDRLSEIVSPMKGGRHVVASYMFYWPDKVKVFLAINSGFVEGDAVSTSLDRWCKSLKGIALAPG